MRYRGAFALVFLACVAPSVAAAQQRECDISAPGRSENTGGQIIVLHDPFTVLCRDGAQLRANSGRLNQATRELHLTGDVHFQDADRTLTSREATYNRVAGRLWAQGDVVFVNRVEGSTLRGPELEYFRATEERPLSQVLATRRPTLVIEPTEAEGGEDPMHIVADRLLILGDDDLSAFESVLITRRDLRATSDEARYNSTTEDLELRGDARIVNAEHTLSASVIQARLTEGSLEHVHARTNALLQGEDTHVAAPDLQLFFAADSLRRTVAVSPSDADAPQALARSRDFELVADSIDASFIDQKIREVHAVGSARAETTDATGDAAAGETAAGDTVPPARAARPAVLASDWVRGDTVIAYFEPVARLPVDSAGIPPPQGEDEAASVTGDEDVELRRLVAIGSAQSLYRMTAEGQPRDGRRNVNFLVGARIDLDLMDGELSVASVKGLERGIYLEATADAIPPELPAPPLDGATPSVPPEIG